MARYCKKSDLLLDIGTGGGEALLAAADAALLLIGIDLSDNMIKTANRNLVKSGRANVRFLQMDADKLEFPARLFNIVSCRQSPFNAGAVSKVLAPGGVFLTQQVREDDKWNLKQWFGRGQSLGTTPGSLQQKYKEELNQAGFPSIQILEYNTTSYYASHEDLVTLLKLTPIIPDFGREAADFERLSGFIEENRTDKGIKTNMSRFMIIASK